MDQYRKLIIILCFLLSINNFVQSQIVSDSVFCYLTNDNNQNVQNAFSMKLIVHNASKDSVFIEHFNRYISHSSTFNFRQTQERIHYWDLLTLSNQEPEVAVTISPPMDIRTSRKRVEEKNTNIVIPPKSTFVSDVYMLYFSFVIYPKGYYKLCLFDKSKGKCIAETIVEIK